MSKLNRRSFLKASSAGAATMGVLALAPRMVGPHDPQKQLATTVSTAAQESPGVGAALVTGIAPTGPVMAYVRDAAKGEIVVMIGTQESVRIDPDLVARLLQVAV